MSFKAACSASRAAPKVMASTSDSKPPMQRSRLGLTASVPYIKNRLCGVSRGGRDGLAGHELQSHLCGVSQRIDAFTGRGAIQSRLCGVSVAILGATTVSLIRSRLIGASGAQAERIGARERLESMLPVRQLSPDLLLLGAQPAFGGHEIVHVASLPCAKHQVLEH